MKSFAPGSRDAAPAPIVESGGRLPSTIARTVEHDNGVARSVTDRGAVHLALRSDATGWRPTSRVVERWRDVA